MLPRARWLDLGWALFTNLFVLAGVLMLLYLLQMPLSMKSPLLYWCRILQALIHPLPLLLLWIIIFFPFFSS